jgi:hypothetical protein
MATDKKKKAVKVRDLKPSKDAKGGGATTNAVGNNAVGNSATSDNRLRSFGSNAGHN